MRKAQREEADNALGELEAADAEYGWLIREANLPEHPDEDDDEGPDADFHSTDAEMGINSRRRLTCGTPLSACSTRTNAHPLQQCHCHLHQWRTICCCLPFDTTLQCVSSLTASPTCSVITLPAFLLPFASFLATALLP